MYRLKVTLLDVQPPVWRLIDVPKDCTFWELHVAIQDAMGWLDCHLHAFEPAAEGLAKPIGIPEYPEDEMYEAGWEVPIARHFRQPGDTMQYQYDFGDNWIHEVRLESVLPNEAAETLPRCLDGSGACPPEDCGGVDGYHDLLEILEDPGHPEHAKWKRWADSRDPDRETFRPEAFDPAAVTFSDPRVRLKELLEDEW